MSVILLPDCSFIELFIFLLYNILFIWIRGDSCPSSACPLISLPSIKDPFRDTRHCDVTVLRTVVIVLSFFWSDESHVSTYDFTFLLKSILPFPTNTIRNSSVRIIKSELYHVLPLFDFQRAGLIYTTSLVKFLICPLSCDFSGLPTKSK